MGNLLLVDDELDILQALEELFRYESGLEIDVYTANSAKKALELLEKVKFDVVMTDIKMPKMSGIELFRLIKERWPKCRVIFLTGFRDFDDLYEISGYKDVRYLQKSEEDEVLVEQVAEAFREIETMMREETERNERQAEILKAQIILKQNVMHDFFRNAEHLPMTQELLNQMNLPIEMDRELFIFLMKMDHFQEGEEPGRQLEREEQLCQIIQEFLPPRFRYYLYSDRHGYYLLFLQPVRTQEPVMSARNWKNLYSNLCGTLEYIQEKALLSCGVSLSFVTCDERCFLGDGQTYLNRLKQEAMERIGSGEQMIRMAESFMEKEQKLHLSIAQNLQPDLKQLERALESGAYGEFLDKLRELANILEQIKEGTGFQRNELYYCISILLLRFINSNHLKAKLEREQSLEELIRVEKLPGGGEAARYLQTIGSSIVEEMELQGRGRSSEVLDKVTGYIGSHISEDLTLNRLAQICYLNPSYLSRLFKQQYGCNLTAYISQVRLERARQLLVTTGTKINEIAQQVGYLSAPSFNRIFKKSTGISPVEYRDRYGKQNGELP